MVLEKTSPTGASYDLENVVFGLGTGINHRCKFKKEHELCSWRF
ncbi:MAG: hypothetical protein CM15mV134_040 [uncultured marine virus]|nr:MAG: hypothetical protein CM15mV134_040 [uncultured marine virus]